MVQHLWKSSISLKSIVLKKTNCYSTVSREALNVVQKIDKSVLFPNLILKTEQKFIKKPYEEELYKSVPNNIGS